MTNIEETPTPQPDQGSDFVLPRHGAIREDNWPEYESKGLRPIADNDLQWAQLHYGTEHVYTGDPWDWDAGRPLRHKPGTHIYVDPEGIALAAERRRKEQESDRRS